MAWKYGYTIHMPVHLKQLQAEKAVGTNSGEQLSWLAAGWRMLLGVHVYSIQVQATRESTEPNFALLVFCALLSRACRTKCPSLYLLETERGVGKKSEEQPLRLAGRPEPPFSQTNLPEEMGEPLNGRIALLSQLYSTCLLF